MTLGEVYLAEPPRLPRRDAVKIPGSDNSADPEYRQRFIRDADLAAQLWHPHIVAVRDRGEYDGQLWIAMDYVESTDGTHLIRRYPAGLPVGPARRHRHCHRRRAGLRPRTGSAAPRRQTRQHSAHQA